MTTIYGTCVVISLLIYLWLCITDVKKSLSQNIMILIMIISNIGFLSLSLSKEPREAILANKILYLGGCYLPLLYFLTFCEICHIKIKKRLKIIFAIIQTIIYLFVWTIGYNDLYYKNLQYEMIDGTIHILKEYGPAHMLYPLSMFGYFLASAIMFFRAFEKKKTINYFEIHSMIISAALGLSCYIIQRIFNFEINIMPISYLILMSGTLVPVYHSNIYTVTENKDIIYEQINKVGFITFDNNMKYMGANETATDIFEELKYCRIGSKIINPGENLNKITANLEENKKIIQNSSKNKYVIDKKIHIENQIFDTKLFSIKDFKNKCVGYTLEITNETEHYKMLELTKKYNEELTKEVELKTKKIRSIQQKTILGMAQMVESRDLSTGGHIKRTSDVVKIFSKKLLELNMGLDKHFLDLVVRSAPMHDIGKIGVDDAVLRKQGKFTDEEYNKMKKHAEIGGKMVRDILTSVEEEEFVEVAFNIANFHHEKVNGKGYPYGLKGEEIPVEARIMALADVFDALVSKRCYKDAFSYDKAFSIIEKDAGEHFDKSFAEVFLQCRDELENYYNNNI